MPGVLAVLTGADALADGLKPIPHHANPGTPPDIVLKNRDGSAGPDRAASRAAGRSRPLRRHRRRVRALRRAFRRPRTRPNASLSTTSRCRPISPRPLPPSESAPRFYDDVPNILIDADFGNAAKTAEAFAHAAARHAARHLDQPRDRRADGAARIARRLRSRQADATRSMPDRAAWCGRSASSRPSSACRVEIGPCHRQGDRRQFRHAQRLLSRVRAGAPGARAENRRPVKWTCDRHEAFISDYQARDL